MFNFEQLYVYQKSLTFTYSIYQLTNRWPREHLYGISDQLKRAAVSISANIAEGSSRKKKEFKHFLDIAKGSCFECIPLLEIALQLQLIDQRIKTDLYNQLQIMAKMITKLQLSL